MLACAAIASSSSSVTPTGSMYIRRNQMSGCSSARTEMRCAVVSRGSNSSPHRPVSWAISVISRMRRRVLRARRPWPWRHPARSCGSARGCTGSRRTRRSRTAAVADLDVCRRADAMRGGGVLPVGNGRQTDDGAQHLDDVVLLAAGDERGGLGELAFELRSIARGQAARHDDLTRAVVEAGISA